MIINRRELKRNAKQVLHKTYFMALVMSIILCAAGAISYQAASRSTGENEGYAVTILNEEFGRWSMSYGASDLINSAGYANSFLYFALGALLTIGSFIVIAMGISFLFRLLIGYPLEIGAIGYFVDTAQGRESGFVRLKHGFKNGAYGNILKTMFQRSLYVFLWSLLLIIPGIVKNYAYSMVPYLLAENPNLDGKRALELSQKMTDGYKMQIFILHLSFIGWELLGVLLLTVGQVLVWPYINATFAQLYLKLRENAFDRDLVSKEELGIDLQPVLSAQ